MISGWVRVLSDRDIEAGWGERPGAVAALSRSTVSPICHAVKDEFAVRSARRLDDVVHSADSVRMPQDLRRQLLEPPVDLGARPQNSWPHRHQHRCRGDQRLNQAAHAARWFPPGHHPRPAEINGSG